MSVETKYKEPHSESESLFAGLQSASQECVKQHPLSYSMLALGAGAALGLVIATSIGRRDDERRSSYFKQLGNQLAESVGGVLPDSFHWKS